MSSPEAMAALETRYFCFKKLSYPSFQTRYGKTNRLFGSKNQPEQPPPPFENPIFFLITMWLFLITTFDDS